MFGKLKMLLYLATKLRDMNKVEKMYVIKDLECIGFIDDDGAVSGFKNSKRFNSRLEAELFLLTYRIGYYHIMQINHVYYDIP